MFTSCFVLFGLLFLFCFQAHATNLITVEAPCGVVVGHAVDTHNIWKGIPYGQDTGGANRFKPPQPKSVFKQPYQATTWQPACPQSTPLQFNPDLPVSEDCLFLNVWAPATFDPDAKADLLPVLVWIHGGGFLFGTGADPTFTATTHVNRSEIVVVTINYRLMAFGFINTPGDDGFAGNYGLQDQQLALKWIQSNIKAFGGDPSQVTISGQSAGAMSSSLHMLMPSSKGLFSSAIIQSNPWGQRYRTPEENLSYADKLAEHLGCSDSTNVTCLQSVPMDDLIKASGTQSYEVGLPLSTLMFLPWMPAVESAMIEKQPLDMIAEGNYDKTIPFLIGTTANESAYFIPPLNVNALEYKLVVDAIFTKDAKAVLEQYPAEGNLNKLFIDLITDYLFFCPVRWVTTLLADNDNVHMYQFLHAPEHDPRGLEKCVGYSCHGADLAYAFHSTKNVNGTWSAEERTLSNMMSSRWGVFVNSGKTPGSGWPLYNIDSNTSLTFDLDSQGQATEELVTNYRGAFCNFWDTIGYTF